MSKKGKTLGKIKFKAFAVARETAKK